MKSIVKTVKYKNETKTGSRIYKIELEDGAIGDYFSKTESDLPEVGKEIEYEYTPNKIGGYVGTIKVIRPRTERSFGSKKNEKAENAREALREAVKIKAAGLSEGMKTLEIAESFFNWLEKHSA